MRIAFAQDYYEGISIELCPDHLILLSAEDINEGKAELQCPHLAFSSAGELIRERTLERSPGLYCYTFYFSDTGASVRLRDLKASLEKNR